MAFLAKFFLSLPITLDSSLDPKTINKSQFCKAKFGARLPYIPTCPIKFLLSKSNTSKPFQVLTTGKSIFFKIFVNIFLSFSCKPPPTKINGRFASRNISFIKDNLFFLICFKLFFFLDMIIFILFFLRFWTSMGISIRTGPFLPLVAK